MFDIGLQNNESRLSRCCFLCSSRNDINKHNRKSMERALRQKYRALSIINDIH